MTEPLKKSEKALKKEEEAKAKEAKAAEAKAAEAKAAEAKAAEAKAKETKAKETKVEMTPEAIQAMVDKGVKAGLAAKEKKEEEAKAAIKSKIDSSNAVAEYEQFTELYFTSLREGVALKDGPKEKLETLKKKIKERKGHMPKRTRSVHMGAGNGVIRIAEGYPVPEELYQRFVEKGNADVYFE